MATRSRIRTDHEQRLWIEAFLVYANRPNTPVAVAADAADNAVERFVLWRDRPSEDPTP